MGRLVEECKSQLIGKRTYKLVMNEINIADVFGSLISTAEELMVNYFLFKVTIFNEFETY